MAFRVAVQRSEYGGVTAVVPGLPGCISQGRTLEEALANIAEAVTLYLEPIDQVDGTPHAGVAGSTAPIEDLLRSLERDGWVPVRQRGIHVRLHNRIGNTVLVMTVPAVEGILDSTVFHIMSRATVDVDRTRRSAWGPQGRDKLHTLWKGHRMRAVGNHLYFRPEQETFHEFLIWMLWRMLNPKWLREVMEQQGPRQHQLARWFLAYQPWQRSGQRPENEVEGGWRMPPSGDVQSLIALAYDIYHLLHSGNFWGKVFRRLRDFEQFQGARYEIAIAAIFSRLGYKLAYHKGGTDERHPEFIAAHPKTNNEIAVEAKSRHRPGVLHVPGERRLPQLTVHEVISLFEEAIGQCPEHLPAVVFVDLNIPATPATGLAPQWFDELGRAMLERFGDPTPQKPDPFNVLFMTNFPYHWAETHMAPPTQRGYVVSLHPRRQFPTHLIREIDEAVANYGFVPDERF